MIVKNAASEKHAREVLCHAHARQRRNICFHRWPTNRVWTRDSGCMFVVAAGARRDGSLRPSRSSGARGLTAIKWRFNAWAKYSNWKHDEKFGSRMVKAARAADSSPRARRSRVVLEGGSIEVNGRGTLITTEECLLSKTQQRNPAMSRKDFERLFSDIWE